MIRAIKRWWMAYKIRKMLWRAINEDWKADQLIRESQRIGGKLDEEWFEDGKHHYLMRFENGGTMLLRKPAGTHQMEQAGDA